MDRIDQKLLICLAVILLAAGCSTTKVERVAVGQKIDVSGDWNDYDAMQVAEEMIKDSLSGHWLSDYNNLKKHNPTVIIGHITNRSQEHINTQVFVKYLERALTNSGKVIFVVSPEEREQIRDERDDQQAGNTLQETIKQKGKELGADFMLIGSQNSIKDAVRGKAVVFYQTNLELIDLETNQKVWIGQHQIKKVVKKSNFSL